MNDEKINCYFLMPDEKPDVQSFLKMAHEINLINFDDEKFSRVMILTPSQMSNFLHSLAENVLTIPFGNFSDWIFAGFMIRILKGKIE